MDLSIQTKAFNPKLRTTNGNKAMHTLSLTPIMEISFKATPGGCSQDDLNKRPEVKPISPALMNTACCCTNLSSASNSLFSLPPSFGSHQAAEPFPSSPPARAFAQSSIPAACNEDLLTPFLLLAPSLISPVSIRISFPTPSLQSQPLTLNPILRLIPGLDI